jgi:hypothetical protein
MHLCNFLKLSVVARLLLLAGCSGDVDESSVAAAASYFASAV